MDTPAPTYLVLLNCPPPIVFSPVPGPEPWTGQAFPLQTTDNVIGRPPGAHVTISLPWWQTISKRHALVAWNGIGAWEIEDLASRHGTEVNGQKLQSRSRVTLCDGDRIRISDVEFLFTAQIAPPTAPAKTNDRNMQDRMTS